jgi:hypothetical protein
MERKLLVIRASKSCAPVCNVWEIIEEIAMTLEKIGLCLQS